MAKLIDKHYKGRLCQRIEEYLIDTDSELQDLPKAPAGSYAISVESGKTFYVNSNGEWPEDPSKYTGAGGMTPEGTITITENGTHDVTEYASAEVMVQSGDGWDVVDAVIDGSISGDFSSDVEAVSFGAFSSCAGLTTANFPLATSISDYAFRNCTNLTNVNAPQVKGRLGMYVFSGCTSLQQANFPNVTQVGSNSSPSSVGTFANCTSLESINFPSLTDLNNYAFYGCTKLTSVSLPKVTVMGDYAFLNCTSLESVDFPLAGSLSHNSGTAKQCFRGCTNLKHLNFPMARRILDYAFYDCISLAFADFPSVITIFSKGFYGCSVLDTLVLRSETVCTLSNVDAFTGTPFAIGGTGGTVYVPQALIEDYKIATNWSTLYEAGTCTFLPIEGSEYE